jgi:hypothetical protein
MYTYIYIYWFIQASHLRKLVVDTMGKCKQVLELIANEQGGWGWAKNVQHQGKLNEALDQFRAKLSPFQVKFISEDLPTVKRKHADQIGMVTKELVAFKKFAVELAELYRIYESIAKKHQIDG